MLRRLIADTLSPTELCPYEPHPSVNDGMKALYTSPIPPKVDGEFQMIRIAFISVPKRFARASSFVWIAAECPRPLNSTI